MIVGKLTGTANASLLACVTQKFYRLIIGVRHLRVFLDSLFHSFSFSQWRYRPDFACVCEVQLRLCVSNWVNFIKKVLVKIFLDF